MKRDRTGEKCTPTFRQCVNAFLFALGLGMAIAYIGPRDLESAEVTASIVQAAVNVGVK